MYVGVGSLTGQLKTVLTVMVSFQVELSLEAANLAQRNATLGTSDCSAGKFMTCFTKHN
jgi:hypothetical protein